MRAAVAGLNVIVAVLAILATSGAALAQDDDLGQTTYDKWCSQCHGEKGDGQGIATPYLQPQPRDFTSCKYKVRMTPTGSLPTDDDLHNAIRHGLPYSAMPAFTNLSQTQLDAVIGHIKSFCADFEDPDTYLDNPIEIPQPPAYDADVASTKGREVFEATGCGRCHGNLGRGDGGSAPTLKDDFGHYVKVADLTKPWTFRGGGTRRDIFRTMSTGFNGTPMPGFYGSLPPEDIWAITDYILSLSGGPQESDPVEAPYANLLRAVGSAEPLDLERGAELFADAPAALFPVVGQVMEPGRMFYPSANAVEVRAVFDEDDIAFLVRWHDMRAETSGHNAPDLAAPLWLDELAATGAAAPESSEEGGGDFWGTGDESSSDGGSDDGGDFWGTGDAGGADSGSDDGGDFWGTGDDSSGDSGGDSGGDGGGDFWGDSGGEDAGAAAAPAGPDQEFSDAVAIQLPQSLPAGIGRPYFLFGDASNPVDLWFRDLAADASALYVAHGSSAIAPGDGEAPESVAQYDNGEWSVIFKRSRKGRSAISFTEGTYVPIAFSIWDGFNRERGNRRGLTVWQSLYLEPREKPSPWGAMAQAAAGVLVVELAIIGWIRRRRRKSQE